MMRALAIACLLLCLAACSSPDPARQVACTVEKVADLPARQVFGAVLVPAAVNQTAVLMQVDTGASTSSVTPAAAMALGLPPDARRRSTVLGVGSQIVTRNTLVSNFEVGHQVGSSKASPRPRLPARFMNRTGCAASSVRTICPTSMSNSICHMAA